MRLKIHNFDPDRKIGIFSIMEHFMQKGFAFEVHPASGGRILITIAGKRGRVTKIFIVYSDAPISESKIFGKCLTWGLFKSDEERTDDDFYYVFIYFDKSTYKYRYFIVPNADVAKYLSYEHKHWLESKTSHKDNAFRAFRLGLYYEKYNHDVSMVYDFEDKWDIIKP